MEEQQRTRSHTVNTTTSSFAENFSTTSSSFAYDREFLRTLPGLLIVAEIVSAQPARVGGGRGSRTNCQDPRAGFGESFFVQPRLLRKVQNSEPLLQLRLPLGPRVGTLGKSAGGELGGLS